MAPNRSDSFLRFVDKLPKHIFLLNYFYLISQILNMKLGKTI